MIEQIREDLREVEHAVTQHPALQAVALAAPAVVPLTNQPRADQQYLLRYEESHIA